MIDAAVISASRRFQIRGRGTRKDCVTWSLGHELEWRRKDGQSGFCRAICLIPNWNWTMSCGDTDFHECQGVVQGSILKLWDVWWREGNDYFTDRHGIAVLTVYSSSYWEPIEEPSYICLFVADYLKLLASRLSLWIRATFSLVLDNWNTAEIIGGIIVHLHSRHKLQLVHWEASKRSGCSLTKIEITYASKPSGCLLTKIEITYFQFFSISTKVAASG